MTGNQKRLKMHLGIEILATEVGKSETLVFSNV